MWKGVSMRQVSLLTSLPSRLPSCRLSCADSVPSDKWAVAGPYMTLLFSPGCCSQTVGGLRVFYFVCLVFTFFLPFLKYFFKLWPENSSFNGTLYRSDICLFVTSHTKV